MKKYYINITNHCNRKCPFCCMYSSPENNRFMDFDDFYGLLNDLDGDTIIQLEGGEPTLHPQFALFLEYACSLKAVSKVVIDTNGTTINDVLSVITEAAARNKKTVEVKVSYNDFLRRHDPRLSSIIRDTYFATEFLEYISVSANVRGISDYELKCLSEELGNIPMTCYLFNDYGRATANGYDLPPLRVKQIFDQWACIATDGTDFGTDLIARSEYELSLIKKEQRV